MGNGQIQVGDTGNFCLSHRGLAAGLYDVALHAAAVSTSTAESSAHGARMAVDGQPTYWASKFDPEGAVELTVDFGKPVQLQDVEIMWEFPAKSFSVMSSADGQTRDQLFGTSLNSLMLSRVPLGRKLASKAKVV